MNRPIGLYDSGVGGLSVVKEVFRQLPGESILYVGDTARVPYGPRPADEIVAFNREIAGFLVEQGAGLLIVACNTSSALALATLDAECPVPVIGLIEPGAATAVLAGRDIGVIATEGTIRSGAYGAAIRGLSPHAAVRELACPTLVPLVEAGRCEGPEAERVVSQALAPFIANPPEVLVLGCTHYPHLARVIAPLLPGVRLVDPAQAAVARAAAVLGPPARRPGTRARHRFFASGDTRGFECLAGLVLPGVPVAAEPYAAAAPTC